MLLEAETNDIRDLAGALKYVPENKKKDIHNGIAIAAIILRGGEPEPADKPDDRKAG